MSEEIEGLNYEVIQGAEYAKIFNILDPRPLAKQCPYLAGLPKVECLNMISKSDTVTVRFRWLERPRRPYEHYHSEHVSLEVLSVTPNYFEGRMTVPSDWPQPSSDVVIKFAKWAVTGVSFADPKYQPLAELPQEKYATGCLMDNYLVVARKVQHIFRDEPKIWRNDKISADSGWRVSTGSTFLDTGDVDYRPLYSALTCDNSWLHLIDQPVGSAFKRDEKTGLFIPDQTPSYSFTREESEEWWEWFVS